MGLPALNVPRSQGEPSSEAVPMVVDGKEGDESDAKSMETVVPPAPPS